MHENLVQAKSACTWPDTAQGSIHNSLPGDSGAPEAETTLRIVRSERLILGAGGLMEECA